MQKILFIVGTRPEAIKMSPLIIKMRELPELFNVEVCITAQHRQMLDQILGFFKIKVDYDLNLMRENQTLEGITADLLTKISAVLTESQPDLVIVQGDTTTAFTGALAAFYKQIKVAHVEAGLRSHNKYSPFPEEINRKLIASMADFHFAPTENSAQNLSLEGIKANVFVTTNTCIDALKMCLKIISETGEDEYLSFFKSLDFSKRIILLTAHRRESIGDPFIEMFKAIKQIAEHNPEVEIVYPVHLNPNVKKPANEILSGINNVKLIAPLDYPFLVWLMSKSYLVLTDSGGIQEEAPALGKPVLVMRNVTEREEGIAAGTAKLVGTDYTKIISEVQTLLDDKTEYERMAKAVNPYGVGEASEKIIYILSGAK